MRPTPWLDSAKVWLFAVAATALGAAITPWAYNVGKALAEVTANKVTNGMVETVAHWCRQGGIPWFFKGSWALAAVLLLVPLGGWLTSGKRTGAPGSRLRWGGLSGLLTGLLVAGALALAAGGALILAGAFVWRPPEAAAWRGLVRLLPWMLAGVALQEAAFRGMAMGVLLRSGRPAMAILQTAVLWALVTMLVPPDHAAIGNPESAWAGFQLLAGQVTRLGDPLRVAEVLLPLAVLGGVLGLARWRTRSLWLPVGFHAGWVGANHGFLAVASPLPQSDPIASALTGDNLMQGLFTAVALALAGIVLHFLTPPPRDHAA
jgi:membrane protease YdiL (CAAX protease family)